jgi:hypothetical protein
MEPTPENPAIAIAYDSSNYKPFVDVGGGRGDTSRLDFEIVRGKAPLMR